MTTREAARGPAVLEVIDPGVLTTVQDAGRPGLAAEGVTRGGAADPWSLAVANVLVGNEASAAALELTLLGPTVRALRPVTVGIAGAIAATIAETGDHVAPGSSVRLRAGWTLAFGAADGGARGYLAIPGGVAVPPVLGSRSTALGAGFGGFEGRGLVAGDRVAAMAADAGLNPPPARWSGPPIPSTGPIRVIAGPHLVDPRGPLVAALARTPWTVSPHSDRVGIRLEGTRLAAGKQGELASHGVVVGAIQLPPGGAPIVLLVDHQPTGGYPVIATVITADLPRLGQAAPGQPMAFRIVTPREAHEALVDASRVFENAVAHLREAARWDDLWHGAGG